MVSVVTPSSSESPVTVAFPWAMTSWRIRSLRSSPDALITMASLIDALLACQGARLYMPPPSIGTLGTLF